MDPESICRSDLTMTPNWRSLADNVLQESLANPVTQNEPSGPDSEIAYLKNLSHTHIDTVARVGAKFDVSGLARPQVLEMGAYFGVVSMALARGGIHMTAQDLSSITHRAPLLQRYQLEGVTPSAVDDVSQPLPYADHSFDALICCEMLEHLPFNTVRLIREMKRVLKSDGFAFLAVPNQASAKRRLQLLLGKPIREQMSSWISAPNDDNWHWREYVTSEFRQLLEGGGFNKIDLGYRHYTPPAHPNRIRRIFVNLMYALKPSLMDNIYVFAS